MIHGAYMKFLFSPSRVRMAHALSPWTPSVAAKTNIRPLY